MAEGQEAGGAAQKLGAKAADALDRVGSRAKDGDVDAVVREIKGGADDLKGAAVEHGRQLLESAKDQAAGFADQRKDEVAKSVSDIASSLRETGRQFEDRPNIQAFVGSAAEGLDQLANGLRDRSFSDLYADVEEYARRSPVTVGAVAALAGFVLARFIKASSDDLVESGASARASARRAAARRGGGQSTTRRPAAANA